MSSESMAKPIIAVVGAKDFSREYDPPLPEYLEELALRVGGEIAKHNCWLLCGGLTGVMEAVARGAKNENGTTTIGIIPEAVRKLKDNEKDEWPNGWIDVAIFTGLGGGVKKGVGRNAVIGNSCDVMIGLPGSNKKDRNYGTRSEIDFAIEHGTPVVLHEYWKRVRDPGPIDDSKSGVQYFTERDAEEAVSMAEEAVSLAVDAISQRSHKTTVRRSRG